MQQESGRENSAGSSLGWGSAGVWEGGKGERGGGWGVGEGMGKEEEEEEKGGKVREKPEKQSEAHR